MPELLVLIGLALMMVGSLLALWAALRALSRPGGVAGLLLIGPVPIVFFGRGSRAALAILAVVAIAILAFIIIFLVGVLMA